MSDVASLTQQEAAERAALIDVRRYDLELDLTGLLDGETLRSTASISFSCRVPGASTFVDVLADVEQATLNGQPVDSASARRGRLPLSPLGDDNRLVVTVRQSRTAQGEGVLRTVDPTDGLVYVWTSFEPDEARRLWACFDQPDLKAPHAFTVLAPAAWTVTSNCAPSEVTGAGAGVRRWVFPPTPPLSTYVAVVDAGPFHEIRSTRGGHDLGLFCRQSLRGFLERDAEELFDLVDRGLTWFGDRFGQPFPQERYDHVFVPDMGGAMENWGSVTCTDSVVFRSPPTYAQRWSRASLVLHEMAHMWFGDLVTMRWWDDLWLNEAFASWAATWALVGATDFGDAAADFLVRHKLQGYRRDMGPATHPIRGEVPDVAQAMASFDEITYEKGEGVLGQLAAYVGEDAFVAGLRAYFADHAWGNTTLDDLMWAVAAASGRDLSAWTTDWLDRAGTDTLTLSGDRLLARSADGGSPRPHLLAIAGYDVTDGGLDPRGTVTVEVTGPVTPVELPDAGLHLVNAGDLTFAAVRTDPAELAALRERVGALPDVVDRALVVTTAWDMLVKGELGAGELVDTAIRLAAAESSPGVVEAVLGLALRAAEDWSSPADLPARLESVATTAAGLAGRPDHRQAALRALAATASSPTHLDLLDRAATDDLDLAWRVAARRAELGHWDPDLVEALAARDPDPDAASRVLAVRGSLPDAEAKAEVWQAIMIDRRVPSGSTLRAVAQRFWRPLQADLLRGYADDYLTAVQRLSGAGMLAQLSLLHSMFPLAVLDQAFVDAALAVAADPTVSPTVRSTLAAGADTGRRMLAARAGA